MSVEFAANGGMRQTSDPRSPTGFFVMDAALVKWLKRRKRELLEAKANGTIRHLLRLERQEKAIEAERRERADRLEGERKAAVLRRR